MSENTGTTDTNEEPIEGPVDLATGQPIPDTRFADLDIDERIVAALEDRNIEYAFPIQALSIPDALAGKDVLARSKTGSGKTLAFAVPMVQRLIGDKSDAHPRGLILVPTRELAVQVAEETKTITEPLGLKVALAYGGTSVQAQAKTLKQVDILVATPGRLLDYHERGTVDLSGVSIAVLDEADRMLDMGFLPDVHRILSALREDGRQTMLFSATLDGEVGRLAKRYTHEPVRHEIAETTPVVSLAQHRFLPVEPATKVQTLVEELPGDEGLALVFVNTKRGCEHLVDDLRAEGIKALSLHGDMGQGAREQALERFASGKVRVLVATDVAARGLDLDDITHVINWDPPMDDKSYVHRIGRTARAGRTGIGITLVLAEERGDMSRMAARLQLHGEWKEAGLKVHPPRMLYTAKRSRNSLLGRQRRRRV
jgi:ATP-dependent RNA helicase RhlE